MLAGWGVMNKEIVTEYYAQYGSKLPVFYNNAGSYIANNVELLPIKELSKSTSGLWLVDFFNKKNTDSKNTALASDDLTFKNTPETTTPETFNQETTKDSKIEEPALHSADALNSAEVTENNNTIEDEIADTEVKEEPISESEQMAEPIPDDEPSEAVTSAETFPEENITMSAENNIEKSSPHYSYFIIAGSFKNHDNALRLIKELQAKGFVAIVAGTNQYGMTRVAYAGFNTMEEATQQLSTIRQHQNPSAWIMRK